MSERRLVLIQPPKIAHLPHYESGAVSKAKRFGVVRTVKVTLQFWTGTFHATFLSGLFSYGQLCARRSTYSGCSRKMQRRQVIFLWLYQKPSTVLPRELTAVMQRGLDEFARDAAGWHAFHQYKPTEMTLG